MIIQNGVVKGESSYFFNLTPSWAFLFKNYEIHENRRLSEFLFLFQKGCSVQYRFNKVRQISMKFNRFHVFWTHYYAIFGKTEKCKTFKKFGASVFRVTLLQKSSVIFTRFSLFSIYGWLRPKFWVIFTGLRNCFWKDTWKCLRMFSL